MYSVLTKNVLCRSNSGLYFYGARLELPRIFSLREKWRAVEREYNMKKVRMILVTMLSVIMFICAFSVQISATSKLAAPKNFKAVSVTETTIKLKWSKVLKADAYRVFMYNSKTDEYETYKNVTGTNCTVKKLSAGKTYKFKVAALVKNNSKYSVQTKTAKLSIKTKTKSDNTSASTSQTLGQKNAIKKAESYLDFTSFSRKGLIEQLEYEGFSNAEATYAVDHISVDWNKQAAKKAQSYLDYMSFSRQGLIDQLIYEGFTAEQAEYGVKSVGY